MHTGDMFARKRVPNIDVGNGGSGVQFSETLAKAVAGIKNVDTIITGHSPLMTWNDLKELFLGPVSSRRGECCPAEGVVR